MILTIRSLRNDKFLRLFVPISNTILSCLLNDRVTIRRKKQSSKADSAFPMSHHWHSAMMDAAAWIVATLLGHRPSTGPGSATG